MNIKELVRKNILSLAPYSTARDEYSGPIGLFLDANESPWDTPFNRYPDPHQKQIKALLSSKKGVSTEQIFVGNGSDEAIDLVFRVFCDPGKDNVVAIAPSYGMYKVAAATNDVEYRTVCLDENFELDTKVLLDKTDSATKAIFLCSPNNPSGNSFSQAQLSEIIETFHGIVVVDEAYIDFSGESSLLAKLDQYENLIVLQTLSKAWGLAGLRLGLAFASKEIIGLFSRVKYPYNISSATQSLVIEELSKGIEEKVIQTIKEREKLFEQLSRLDIIKHIYPSDANFLLVKVDDPNGLYDELIRGGVIVRNRNSIEGCQGCLRISIGTVEQNKRLMSILTRTPYQSDRCATIERNTRETAIEVSVDLDSTDKSRIDTGLKFLDHMLDQIVHHAGIGLCIQAKGDLHVDEHHTMEDVAIVLGEAIYDALGSKRGIERYGFALPMDEASALVLLDFGGRIDFEWDAHFEREMVGDVPTEMFEHFFKSLATAARCNLHIAAKGSNDHHLIEGIFKAFARALRAAVRRDPFSYDLPSSKGVL